MDDPRELPRRSGGPAKVVPLRPRDAAPASAPARASRMSRLRTLFVIDELDIDRTEGFHKLSGGYDGAVNIVGLQLRYTFK